MNVGCIPYVLYHLIYLFTFLYSFCASSSCYLNRCYSCVILSCIFKPCLEKVTQSIALLILKENLTSSDEARHSDCKSYDSVSVVWFFISWLSLYNELLIIFWPFFTFRHYLFPSGVLVYWHNNCTVFINFCEQNRQTFTVDKHFGQFLQIRSFAYS
jgi:hypothetical protein